MNTVTKYLAALTFIAGSATAANATTTPGALSLSNLTDGANVGLTATADYVNGTSETFDWGFTVAGTSAIDSSFTAAKLSGNLSQFSEVSLALIDSTESTPGHADVISVGSISPMANGTIFADIDNGSTSLVTGHNYILELIATALKSNARFDGNLNVAAVPVPGAIVLFASGLIGLMGFGRRRSAARTAA